MSLAQALATLEIDLRDALDALERQGLEIIDWDDSGIPLQLNVCSARTGAFTVEVWSLDDIAEASFA